MAGDPVFLDTSVLVAASIEAHPGHTAAGHHIAGLVADQAPLCISPQVCREFLVVLTRQPVAGRTFAVAEALDTLARWRRACALLEENEVTVAECLALVERHEVRGKQVHDCNLVAVMLVHGVKRLATRNAADFVRFNEIVVDALTP